MAEAAEAGMGLLTGVVPPRPHRDPRRPGASRCRVPGDGSAEAGRRPSGSSGSTSGSGLPLATLPGAGR